MRKSGGMWIKMGVTFALSIAFSLTAVYLSFGAITIDGVISDVEWAGAQEFVFSSEDPSFDVTALVKWDEEYFYFACKLADPDVQGKHVSGIQNVWEDDDLEYYLETDNQKYDGRSVNSYQILFSAAGAYNDTGGDGSSYDFSWDSNLEHVTALDEGTTINDSGDTDAGWHVESRLPWADMGVDGNAVSGKTMGWNVLITEYPAGTPISWAPTVIEWTNNHNCSAWGEITFDQGYVGDATTTVEPRSKLSTTWGVVKSGY